MNVLVMFLSCGQQIDIGYININTFTLTFFGISDSFVSQNWKQISAINLLLSAVTKWRFLSQLMLVSDASGIQFIISYSFVLIINM